MSDKVEKLGKELELTPEQWADFHKFICRIGNNMVVNLCLGVINYPTMKLMNKPSRGSESC